MLFVVMELIRGHEKILRVEDKWFTDEISK